MRPTAARRSAGRRPRSRRDRPGTPARRPRSRRARSCRWSTRACRPGAARRRRRAGSPPARARAARAGRRPCASARRAARRACRGPSTAGRRARGRRRRARAARRRRRCAPRSTSPAPMRAAVRRSASARPAWRSTATTLPRPSISAARWVVLPPGAAQRSSTRSPGRGASSRATVIAARDCGMKRPSCQSGESNASNGAVEHSPSGRSGAGRVGTGSAAASVGGVGAQRVDAQGGLGGLVVGRHAARARRPGRARRTTARRSTRGASGAARPRRAWRRGARRRAPAASRAPRRRTALTSFAPPGDSRLTSSTDSPTAACAGTRSR